MFLASTHLPPALTISIAAVIAGWIVWYWLRLGRSDVPRSRRKIRRVSLALMFISLPMFVRALSFLDPQVQQREYIIAWSMAILMVLIVMIIAGVDAINSLRMLQRQQQILAHEAANDLVKAIKSRDQLGQRTSNSLQSSSDDEEPQQ